MDIRRVHIEAMLPWAKPDQDSRQAVTKRGVPRQIVLRAHNDDPRLLVLINRSVTW